MDRWMNEWVCSSQMDGLKYGLKIKWMRGQSQIDRWANGYNTLACSEAIGPK